MAQVILMIVGGLVLLAAGAGLGYWYALVGGQRGRADELQDELEQYRSKVNDHFAQTAEHFQTIGREYRALYQHMATGAEALCDPREIDGRLSFAPEQASAATDDSAETASEAPSDAADAAASDHAPEGAAESAVADTVDASPGGDVADDAADRKDAVPDESQVAASVDRDTTDTEEAVDAPEETSTADERARNAGGESAPLDEHDAATPAATADADVPLDDAANEASGDRTYH